jgi:hypothetical protein
MHPFFNDDVTEYSSDVIPYSMSEVIVSSEMSSFILPEEDLLLRKNSLAFLDDFIKTYENLIIKKTKNTNMSQITYTDEQISKYISKFDYFLNFHIYKSQVQYHIDEDDEDLFEECLRACITNKTDEYFDLNERIVTNIMEQDILFIPFKSIVIGFICQARNNCEIPSLISDMLTKIVRGLIRKICNPIEDDFVLCEYILELSRQ